MLDKNIEPSFESLYSLGTELLHQNNARQAVDLLKQALELKPDHLDALINLGGAYILRGRFKSAVDVLEIAVEIDPSNSVTWTNLGAAYLGNPVLARDEEQEKAIGAFRKVLEINPGAPSVAYNIGLIYRDQQKWDKAASWFRKAVKANTNDRDARSLYKKMLARQKGGNLENTR